MNSMIEFGHATHTGLARAHNEDTYWVDAGLGLFVVAGGIGGPGHGEVASMLACRAVVEGVQRGDALGAAIAGADRAIAEHGRTQAAGGPLGATLAALHLDGSHYTAARIGDAHLLGWRDGQLWPIEPAPPGPRTTDRSASAVISPVPASAPHQSTQALGITPAGDLQIVQAEGTFERGTQVLLCSDGLADELDRSRIAAILARTELAAQECVDHLLLAALDAGGHDNLTALLVRIA
ncbi:MAG TPA: PP2C family serine/threonine-protein phosphatase [Rhodanobacteraceae bacterium]|nr:PP2C family serine/threonine-protein phosphatase [Rhodanobacteraceae bacterium]